MSCSLYSIISFYLLYLSSPILVSSSKCISSYLIDLNCHSNTYILVSLTKHKQPQIYEYISSLDILYSHIINSLPSNFHHFYRLFLVPINSLILTWNNLHMYCNHSLMIDIFLLHPPTLLISYIFLTLVFSMVPIPIFSYTWF